MTCRNIDFRPVWAVIAVLVIVYAAFIGFLFYAAADSDDYGFVFGTLTWATTNHQTRIGLLGQQNWTFTNSVSHVKVLSTGATYGFFYEGTELYKITDSEYNTLWRA